MQKYQRDDEDIKHCVFSDDAEDKEVFDDDLRCQIWR